MKDKCIFVIEKERFDIKEKKSLRIYASLLIKLVVVVSALVGIYKSAFAGRHSFIGGSSVFMYFTIQSNILVVVVSLLETYLMMNDKLNYKMYLLKLVTAVSITLIKRPRILPPL